MRSAARSVSTERGLASARLPIGVATTYRVPVNRRVSSFVKRAMNREGARAEDLCAEVRMRGPGGFGGAAESITAAKRARLIAAARLYLTRRPDANCRFDVFLVDGPPRHVQWIRNAFGE